jgi:hypothetical protein
MSRFASAAFKGLKGLLAEAPAAAKVATTAATKPGLGAKTMGFAKDMLVPSIRNPALAAWALPTAAFTASLAQPLVKGLVEDRSPFDKALDEQIRQKKLQLAQQLKARRLQAAMADNMMRLAAANPQLYNQLLAGRTLPNGAVLIGGGQKTDFLESVAYQMATGGFGNAPSIADSPDILQTLVNTQ